MGWKIDRKDLWSLMQMIDGMFGVLVVEMLSPAVTNDEVGSVKEGLNGRHGEPELLHERA